MNWEPPRCVHGNIILGCPHDDCPTQIAYLDQQNAALEDYYRRQEEAVARFVASLIDLRQCPQSWHADCKEDVP